MSESRFFVLLFVGLILIATGVNTSCPIELSPPSVVVKHGDPVAITCTTPMNDHDGIGWEASKGGTGLQKVNALTWTVESLTQWSISPMCYFSSSHPDEQCSIRPGLVIYTFPETIRLSFSSGPSGVMVEGEESVFTCDVLNVAPLQNLSVTWFKGDTIIHKETFNDSTREPVNQSSVLKFTPTREENGSVVRCEARLDLGPVGPNINVSSEEYLVTVFFGPDVSCALDEITEGQTLEEKCVVTGNPTPIVAWFRGASLINSSVPLVRHDSGMYTLEADGFTLFKKKITFTVSYGPELECPVTYKQYENDVQRLTCSVKGYPIPKTIWYKDGEEVELPERFSRRDAGQYVITASNSLKSVNSSVDVVVLYRPSEIVELEDSEFSVGSDVGLKCTSMGNPRPVYSWTYYQTDNVMVESDDGVSRLIIQNATAQNMGTYTCRATNVLGTVEKTATLTVKGALPECPVKITPDTMIVEYKTRGHQATCKPPSTHSSNVRRTYWEVQEDNHTMRISDETWFADTDNGWYSRPACVGEFTGLGICRKKLNFILFKTPDSVSIRPVDRSNSVLEDRAFQLQCDIINVAPAQMLAVRWYRGNESIGPGTLRLTHCRPDDGRNCDISLSKSPVNVTSTINVTLNRLQSGAEFRCEAQLDVGLTGYRAPDSKLSDPLNITVLYKPTINTTKLPKTVPLFRGYPEELVCEAHGRPAPQIEWQYSSDKVVRESEGKLTVYQEGIYNCSARNDVDSTVHVVEVILKEDYLPLIAGFVAVTVIVISVIFIFLYSIYYKNTKMRRYSLKNPKLSTPNGNVATNGWDLPLPMTKLS